MKKRKLKSTHKIHSRKRTHRHKGLFCSCRGGISPKFIVIGGVIILAVAAGGYFMFNNSSSETGGIINKITNPSGKATENDFAGIQDPLLRKFYVAQSNITKIRTKLPVGDLPGAVMVYELETTGGISSGKSNGSVWREQNGKKSSEYMTIGDTTYVKDYSDNKWWTQTKKPEPVQKDTTQTAPLKQEFENLANQPTPDPSTVPQKIGQEPCPNISSLTCYKYSESNTFAGSTSKTIFWFDDKDYLRRKEMQENGTGWTEYEYDNINIQAPSPTKEVPAGKDISEYMAQSYLQGITPQQNIPVQEPPIQIQQNYSPPQDIPQDTPQDATVDQNSEPPAQ
jgi:hypothetical protein